jgi:hypothetical protein
MQRFLGLVVDSNGTPMSGVTVTVKKAGTGTNATLYADNVYTTKTNGFSNDSDGTYEFYAPNGRIDLVYTKGGKTFTDTNSADVILYDPADDSAAVVCRNDFLAPYSVSAGVLLSDGQYWAKTAGVVSVTGDSTYRNGWLDILENAGTQGGITQSNTAGTPALNWVPSTDLIVMDLRVEKQGDAVAGTRRVGLGSAGLSTGDPTNGIFIRQIDAANAFLVCRAGGSESTQDLGQTLNNPTRIRVMITTSSVRAFVDDVAKTAVTTQIPTAILGLSAGGGATASAAGLRLDYLNAYTGVRI